MALFSRRPKDVPGEPAAQPAPESVEAAEPEAAEAPVSENETSQQTPDAEHAPDAEQPEAAASIDISVSAFRGLGAPQRHPSVPAEAPKPTESVPGLRDNVLLREALAALSDPTKPQELLNVARQLLQGHLYLRVKGDARSLLAEGKELPLAVATVNGQSFMLAYSGGAALQASVRQDGDTDTSAMGQPVLTVLRHLLNGGYQGLVIDQASAPARAVLPRDLLERLLDKGDESFTVKTLLAEQRTPETAAAVAQALTHVPLWVAVGGPDGERPGIAEGRSEDGSRYMEVYSHPVEVAAMGRGDQAAPLTGAQLAGALRSDEAVTGIIINPQGPWIRLTRSDLAPLLALAD